MPTIKPRIRIDLTVLAGDSYAASGYGDSQSIRRHVRDGVEAAITDYLEAQTIF